MGKKTITLIYLFIAIVGNAQLLINPGDLVEGSTVYFGKYPRQSLLEKPDTGVENKDWITENGKYFTLEPIAWRVIEVDNMEQNLFLISDENIDNKPYHDIETEVTWETSSIREWLNSTQNDGFMAKAFHDIQQSVIATSTLVTPNSGTAIGGNNTEDKVFLLTPEEFQKAQAANTAIAVNTGYTARFSKTYPEGATDFWFLRVPGIDNPQKVAMVSNTGVYLENQNCVKGVNVTSDDYGIRPALRLNYSEIIILQEEGKNFVKFPVTYTATETKGHSYTKSSTGIELTFDQPISGLFADDITITDGTGSAIRGELTGSGDTWIIALDEVIRAGSVTVSIKNDYLFSTTVAEVSIIKAIPLSGNVSIPQIAEYGETITTSTGGHQNNAGKLTYIWKHEGETDTIGLGMNYTIKSSDIGKKIIVEVSSSVYSSITAQEATEVIPRSLTISGITASNREYMNGKNTVTLNGGIINGVINNDDIDFDLGDGLISDPNASDTPKPVTVNITLTGDDKNYYTLAQPTDIAVTISKTEQSIDFNPPSVLDMEDVSYILSASSTSGLQVMFKLRNEDNKHAEINGNILTLKKEGEIEVSAYTDPNPNYSETQKSAIIIITDKATGIEERKNNGLSAIVKEGILEITGLEIGNQLQIYNTIGVMVYNKKVNTETKRIQLPSQNIYIIISGNKNLKIIY